MLFGNASKWGSRCQMMTSKSDSTKTFYFACYLPSIGYPLPASSLTRSQLEKVQCKAMSIIVPRCGFNRNTKKEILFGPLSLGGANFRHLYIEQGIGQVTTFLKHVRSQSKTGKLFQIALSWFQLAVGVSFPILENTRQALPHLESRWLASLRIFLASQNASIHLLDPYIPHLQRIHDAYIMDAILQSNQFSPAQIRHLNYCRLYLQAVTISDITDVAGRSLDKSKLHGKPSLMSSTTTLLHVHQEWPSDTEWTLWRKANLQWSDSLGNLHQPLGPWLMPIQQQRNQHFAYKLPTKMIVIRTTDTFLVCQPRGHND